MNWNETKKKYSKGYELLCDWGLKSTRGIFDLVDRDLYDFFDEQGIYIQPFREIGGTWRCFIDEDDGKVIVVGQESKSRKEAEEASFLKAFKILEDDL